MRKCLEMADATTEAEGDYHIALDNSTKCNECQELELIPLEGATVPVRSGSTSDFLPMTASTSRKTNKSETK